MKGQDGVVAFRESGLARTSLRLVPHYVLSDHDITVVFSSAQAAGLLRDPRPK